MQTKQLAVAAAALSIVSPFWTVTGVAKPAPKPNGPSALALIEGSCDRLVLSGEDISSDCGPKLLNTTYKDGQSGFYFATRDGAVVTFSGPGQNQVKQGPDRVVQPINLVIFSHAGETDRYRAVGSCDFTNPYRGAARISCSATTPVGAFEGNFVTDGKPPQVKHF